MKEFIQPGDALLARLHKHTGASAGKDLLKMADERFICKHLTRVMWILLYLILVFSVFGIFVVKWTRTSYRTEENSNITVRWDSGMKMDPSVTSLTCAAQSEPVKVIYQMTDGVEVTDSQHEQFAGRVHLDRDALSEGRIRLHLSTVTAEDSGGYRCDLVANYDESKGRWELESTEHFVLNVLKISNGDVRDTSSYTAGPNQPPERSQQDLIWIIAAAALVTLTVAATVVFVAAIVVQLRKPRDKKILTNLI